MIDSGNQLDLAKEAVGGDADLQLGMEDLERDPCACGVLSQEYPRGAPPTDLPVESVPGPDGLLNDGQQIAADGQFPVEDTL